MSVGRASEDRTSVERSRYDDGLRTLFRSSRLDRAGERGRRILVALAPFERYAPSIERRLGEQCGGVDVRAGQELAGTWLVRREAGAAERLLNSIDFVETPYPFGGSAWDTRQ